MAMQGGYFRNGIIASTLGDKHLPQCFQVGEDIVIPPSFNDDHLELSLQLLCKRFNSSQETLDMSALTPAQLASDDEQRSFKVMFKGQTHASIRGVRQVIKRELARERWKGQLALGGGRDLQNSLRLMTKSHFCLAPAGYAPWSPRPFLGLLTGCIPVIVSDDIILPFEDRYNWSSFAVHLPEKDLPNVHSILTAYTPQQRMDLRRAGYAASRDFIITSKRQPGWWGRHDGFDMLLMQLAAAYNKRRARAQGK